MSDTGDLWFLNSRVTVALAQADNADGISVLDHQLPPGDAPPLHVHHGEDEVFHLLAGEVMFEVGGEKQVVRAGQTICAPRAVPHRYRVTSPEGARYLTITRGGFERMVRNAARPPESAGLPPMQAPTPEMQRRLAELCAAQNIEILGPPLD